MTSRFKLELSSSAVSVLMRFEPDTFTIEFNHSPGLEQLLKLDLLKKHPGGPFGSRNSYYRTERGTEIWSKLRQVRSAH